MIEVLPYIIIGILLAYHYFSMKQVREERKEFMNAIIAKNATELRDLKMADNVKVEVQTPAPPDVEPFENLSTEEHFKAVMKQQAESIKEEDDR